ncbi:metal-sulfur cluster biosynthetic enzyme [Mycolicibacter heraklionensis]|uniref:Metal-sulfur cluster assembly factor n=1 Tax=Mycolicibacter heraklionensis TaxID=512402 RepID=A0A9X7WD94_9MYCO|nr:metal-sulfur cluster assembly factor [Mycolicibacter heraklionensis]KLO31014.1 metal-sulfur cluster biosynthetic enzyme [Mycolicibacter heraklionensis]QZA05926.1 metal-sulfur cluster assembly factor [Mycolicibacter heraklionensis]
MSELGPDELLAEVEESMHDVIDPEIGINVVDLGLMYDLSIRQDDGGPTAVVTMTLTSPACPLQDMIAEQVENATVGAGLVKKVDLSWVWEPAWGPDKITDEGREMMRAVGFTV